MLHNVVIKTGEIRFLVNIILYHPVAQQLLFNKCHWFKVFRQAWARHVTQEEEPPSIIEQKAHRCDYISNLKTESQQFPSTTFKHVLIPMSVETCSTMYRNV
jgi:hypothetical protein